MMLDLEVQAADEPRQQAISSRKVDSRLDLVYSPCSVHPPGIGPWQRKGCALHAMRRLKHGAEQYSLGERGYDVNQQHRSSCVQQERNDKRQREE